MSHPATSGASQGANAARWAARALSALVILFWGFFLLADVLGGGEGTSLSLGLRDYVGLAAMGAWLVGLAVAWKWELIGGVTALVAFMISGVANMSVFSLPFWVIPAAAGFFLVSWWLRRVKPSEAIEDRE